MIKVNRNEQGAWRGKRTLNQTHFWFRLLVKLWLFSFKSSNKHKKYIKSCMFYVKHQSKCFYFVFAVIEINERFLHNKKREIEEQTRIIEKDQLVRKRTTNTSEMGWEQVCNFDIFSVDFAIFNWCVETTYSLQRLADENRQFVFNYKMSEGSKWKGMVKTW